LTKTIEVEIYGQRFSVNGAAEDGDGYVRKLADMVDQHMKQVAQGMKTATPHKIAVLAALNIAHELCESEKKIQRLQADMERRMVSLMESIDEQMPSSTALR
jgi:cell division protein ZapA